MRKSLLIFGFRCLASLSLFVFAANLSAQTETPPEPLAPRTAKIPAVVETKLKNDLIVAVANKTAAPLVTIQMLIRSGAGAEKPEKAGLANLTASMLTKGTKTRSATQIAEEIEFLGGSINSGAGWNSSFVAVTVTSDKVEQAIAVLADVVLNPKFDQEEIDLLKSQTLDGLTYNLKQPSFLANYAASKYTFGEHPAGGTPASINSITKADIEQYYSKSYLADDSVLIFTGNITNVAANSLARKYFSKMPVFTVYGLGTGRGSSIGSGRPKTVQRILVIDLPKSGQASVNYYKRARNLGRITPEFFPASVYNSVLGGGYSSRLNMEIRIKRGLSYGAGSNFGWRSDGANFGTRAQTKNESAAEVAQLVVAEIDKMADTSVTNDEMIPRKSVLTGGFGRNLETTAGLANAVADLYSFYVPVKELNNYIANINKVTESEVRAFGLRSVLGGDMIIVGDYSIFKDDLAKRFPGMKVEVIKADDIDLSKDNLRK